MYMMPFAVSLLTARDVYSKCLYFSSSAVSSQSLASHCGGPGLIPGQSMWDVWCTPRHWGRFLLPVTTSLSLSLSPLVCYITSV